MKRTLFLCPLVLALACHAAAPSGAAIPPVTTAHPTATATSVASAPPAAKPPAPPAFPAGWPYSATATPVTGKRGMVVSDATIATKVGAEVLAQGGNAVDAAVALAFALAVSFPAAGNIGGGGFLVARVGGQPYALDFRETAPAAATHDIYMGKDGKPTDASKTGYKAAGVPGSVAGLYAAYEKLGSKKKTWAELLAPAIALAKDGFVVDEGFNEMIAKDAEDLAKFPSSKALYLGADGKAPAVGATWKDPDLAAVLERIAQQGPKGFYEGTTADLVDAEMKRGHGLITKDDLKAYQAKWRTPIEIDYRGHHLTMMPPPSSGGVTVGMMAHILEGYDLAKLGWHTPESLNLTWEASRRAFAARNAMLGDPDFVKNPVDELLSPAWAERARATITPGKKTPEADLRALKPQEEGPHTTHFSIVDADGNAVALTTTLNWWFGCDVAVTGAGFVLNNEMDDFAVVPGQANGFGLVQGEPNAVAPNKRMLSSMSPTIVTGKDGHVELVTGAAGGPTIITTTFQILSNVIDYGMSVTAAENAPRFHAQDHPDSVYDEPGGFDDALGRAMAAMGYSFKERGHVGDASSIGFANGAWIGAAEPRRKGSLAFGVP